MYDFQLSIFTDASLEDKSKTNTKNHSICASSIFSSTKQTIWLAGKVAPPPSDLWSLDGLLSHPGS